MMLLDVLIFFSGSALGAISSGLVLAARRRKPVPKTRAELFADDPLLCELLDSIDNTPTLWDEGYVVASKGLSLRSVKLGFVVVVDFPGAFSRSYGVGRLAPAANVYAQPLMTKEVVIPNHSAARKSPESPENILARAQWEHIQLTLSQAARRRLVDKTLESMSTEEKK